jgi:putative transposase
MQFYENNFYHIYNRTNNDEALFKIKDNYIYFLKKYRHFLDIYFETIAYCLMPTHFHFLVKIRPAKDVQHQEKEVKDVQHLADVGHLTKVGHLTDLNLSKEISKAMQTLQSSYTKAINKMFERHGSLFQPHFKSKIITEEKYYLALATYIHQNPIRSSLVEKAENWEFSSFKDYIGYRKGSLPNIELLLSRFSITEIVELTNNKANNYNQEFEKVFKF